MTRTTLADLGHELMLAAHRDPSLEVWSVESDSRWYDVSTVVEHEGTFDLTGRRLNVRLRLLDGKRRNTPRFGEAYDFGEAVTIPLRELVARIREL